MFSAADSNVSAISSTLIFLGADCGGDGTKIRRFQYSRGLYQVVGPWQANSYMQVFD
jgi:hypothetical protein